MTDLTPDQISQIEMLLEAAKAGVPANEWEQYYVASQRWKGCSIRYGQKIINSTLGYTYRRRRPRKARG